MNNINNNNNNNNNNNILVKYTNNNSCRCLRLSKKWTENSDYFNSIKKTILKKYSYSPINIEDLRVIYEQKYNIYNKNVSDDAFFNSLKLLKNSKIELVDYLKNREMLMSFFDFICLDENIIYDSLKIDYEFIYKNHIGISDSFNPELFKTITYDKLILAGNITPLYQLFCNNYTMDFISIHRDNIILKIFKESNLEKRYLLGILLRHDPMIKTNIQYYLNDLILTLDLEKIDFIVNNINVSWIDTTNIDMLMSLDELLDIDFPMISVLGNSDLTVLNRIKSNCQEYLSFLDLLMNQYNLPKDPFVLCKVLYDSILPIEVIYWLLDRQFDIYFKNIDDEIYNIYSALTEYIKKDEDGNDLDFLDFDMLENKVEKTLNILKYAYEKGYRFPQPINRNSDLVTPFIIYGGQGGYEIIKECIRHGFQYFNLLDVFTYSEEDIDDYEAYYVNIELLVFLILGENKIPDVEFQIEETLDFMTYRLKPEIYRRKLQNPQLDFNLILQDFEDPFTNEVTECEEMFYLVYINNIISIICENDVDVRWLKLDELIYFLIEFHQTESLQKLSYRYRHLMLDQYKLSQIPNLNNNMLRFLNDHFIISMPCITIYNVNNYY